MAEKRQLELLLVRFLPHALRDDFVTVGVLLLEADGGFADLRFTRDWRMLQCVAPEVETEWFELVEREIRGRLGSIRRREDLLELVGERFGTMLDVAPAKGVLTEDPAKEMEVLAGIYLAPTRAGMPAPHERTGRGAIVLRMKEAFAEAGVLELLQRDLDMREFTGESDPFAVDFGFRVGRSLKMFQALALNLSREPAVTLAYRYGRIRDGMRARGEEALMTAIIHNEVMSRSPRLENRETWGAREVASGIAMLKASEIAVRRVGEMEKIASEVRQEIGA